MTDTDRLVTIPEAVELARVSERTLRRWVAQGRIRAHRSEGGRFRVRLDRADIDAMTTPVAS